MRSKKSVTKYILLVAGIILLLNLISSRFFFRLDFTEDQRYTLSGATKNILSSLKEPVTVTAYFSEDLPPDIAKTRKDFKELLVEYASRSHGKVVYDFVNPRKDEETEQKAAQQGVQPVMVNMREKDQVKQQKAYLGAVIQLGERKEVIPFMQPGAAMEYALSSGIKKLSVPDKKTVALLKGHGEASLASMQQAHAALSVLYEVEEVSVSDTAGIPERVSTLAIVNPTDTFPPGHLAQLDRFLARGGNMLIAYSKNKGDFSKSTGDTRSTGIEDFLGKRGVVISGDFIVDASCGSVTVRQQQGMFQYNTNMNFPYFPISTNFENHPVTKGLESVIFVFASPIFYRGDSSLSYLPIVKSSKKSAVQKSPVFFNVQQRWTDRDFPMSNLAMGAVLKGKLSGNMDSKMVIFSNGSFAVNGEGQQAQQVQPDNLNLFVNAMDWLSDDTGLIELRTKGVSSRPLDQLEDGTKAMLKYLNFLLPVIMIILYGFVRFQAKRNQRINRMQEDYSA